MRICLIGFWLLTSFLFADDFLYVIHAKEASFNESTSTLLLKDIDRSVTFFSNGRPTRAGKSDLDAFLNDFLNQTEPIHSGFIYYAATKEKYSDIDITLYQSSYDSKKKTLSFKIKAEKKMPSTMKEVNLFIDEVSEFR